MPTEISPTRTKRLHEKSSLQNLNNRLELYVLRVKEIEDAKNSAENDLRALRARYQKEIESVKSRLTKELAETRKELDFEIDQKSRLQVLEQEQHSELTKLRKQVKVLGDASALAEKLQAEVDKEKATAKLAKESLASQGTQLQSIQRQFKVLEKEKRQLTATCKDLTSEVEDLRAENAELTSTRDGQLAETTRKLNEAFQEERIKWKKEMQERIDQGDVEVRQHYESIVEGYKAQVDDYSQELDSVKNELERTTKEYDESLKVRQSLVDKLSLLEKEIRAERKKHKEEKRSLDETLDRAKQQRFAKEKEFNELMDVKIALDAEINMYRTILDREESRVGTPLSQKKRKGQRQSGSAKRMKKTLASPIKVHALNLKKDTVTLENTGEKDVCLKGWQVSSEVGKQVFTFPDDYVLKSGHKVNVYSGKRNKPDKSSLPSKSDQTDTFWTKRYMWNNKGDAALLSNPDGACVCRVAEGEIQDYMSDDDEGGENPQAGLDEKQCGIM